MAKIVDVDVKDVRFPTSLTADGVCPHAGGVGLCELVQHLSIIDYLVVSGELDRRLIEYVDHSHEHFVDPCIVKNGAYQLPSQPGYSAEMYDTSIATYSFPWGTYWRDLQAQTPASSTSSPSLSTKV